MLLVKISVLFVYLILVFLIYHLLDFIALNNAELTGYFDPIKLSLQQIRSIFKDQFDQVDVKEISNFNNLGDTSTKQVKRHCYDFNSKNRLELVYTLENSKDVLLIQDDQNCRLSLQLLLNYQQLQTRHLHCVKWLPKWKIELNQKHLNDEEVPYTQVSFLLNPKNSGQHQLALMKRHVSNCTLSRVKLDTKFLCLDQPSSCNIIYFTNTSGMKKEHQFLIYLKSFQFFNLGKKENVNKKSNLNARIHDLDVNLLFNWSLYICSFLGCLSLFTTQSSLFSRFISVVQSVITYNSIVLGLWLLFSSYKIHCIHSMVNSVLFYLTELVSIETSHVLSNYFEFLHEHLIFFMIAFLLFFMLVVEVMKKTNLIRRDQEIETTLSEILLNNNRMPTNDGDISQRWVQRLATPSLWLQPLISMDYISELPVWRYSGQCITSSDDSDVDYHHRSPREYRRSSQHWYQRTSRDQSCSKEPRSCIARNVIRSIRTCFRSRSPCMRRMNNAPEGMREETCCSICLNNYKQHDHVCGLPCHHVFHHSCISSWLHSDQHCCPICRWPAYQGKAKSI